MIYDENGNAQTHHEILAERSRIHAKRVGELEQIARQFIRNVEDIGVQELYEVGQWTDLIDTYQDACRTLGITPQEYTENDEEDDDEPTD